MESQINLINLLLHIHPLQDEIRSLLSDLSVLANAYSHPAPSLLPLDKNFPTSTLPLSLVSQNLALSSIHLKSNLILKQASKSPIHGVNNCSYSFMHRKQPVFVILPCDHPLPIILHPFSILFNASLLNNSIHPLPEWKESDCQTNTFLTTLLYPLIDIPKYINCANEIAQNPFHTDKIMTEKCLDLPSTSVPAHLAHVFQVLPLNVTLHPHVVDPQLPEHLLDTGSADDSKENHYFLLFTICTAVSFISLATSICSLFRSSRIENEIGIHQ